jgi:hypothetical protein
MAISTRVFNLGEITIPGTHPKIINFAALSIPVTDGLTNAYLLGGSIEASERNHADSSSPLTERGTPVNDDTFGAACDYYNCFDTGSHPTESQTWLVIAKPTLVASDAVGTSGGCLISQGSYISSAWAGDQLSFEKGNQIVARGKGYSGGLSISTLDESKYAAFGVYIDYVDEATSNYNLYSRQNGVESWLYAEKIASSRTYLTDGDYTLKIGGDNQNPEPQYNLTLDIGIVVMYDRALSSTEFTTVVDYLSQFMSDTFGISDV